MTTAIRLGLLASTVAAIVALFATGAVDPVVAQEGGASTSTPPAVSTPVAESDSDDSDPSTVTVETCAEDPQTGELTCTETTEPVGVIEELEPVSKETREKLGLGPRDCYFDLDTQEYVCEEEVTISGLASTLTVGSSDEFTVTGQFLDNSNSYQLRVKRGDGDTEIGFPCPSSSQKTVSVPSVSGNYGHEVTVHACSSGGATVTAELLRGGSVIAYSLTKSVTVVASNTNVDPEITGGPGSKSYREGDTTDVGTYMATDDDGDTISWELPDTSFETDRSDFSINSRGELSFNRTTRTGTTCTRSRSGPVTATTARTIGTSPSRLRTRSQRSTPVFPRQATPRVEWARCRPTALRIPVAAP